MIIPRCTKCNDTDIVYGLNNEVYECYACSKEKELCSACFDERNYFFNNGSDYYSQAKMEYEENIKENQIFKCDECNRKVLYRKPNHRVDLVINDEDWIEVQLL